MDGNTLELSKAYRSCDIGHTIIVSNHWKPVAPLRIHSLTSKQSKTSGELVIICRDHAAFASRDDLVSKKTERCAGTMPTYTETLVASPDTFGRVLHNKKPVFLSQS
jgi:hypothetical protein